MSAVIESCVFSVHSAVEFTQLKLRKILKNVSSICGFLQSCSLFLMDDQRKVACFSPVVYVVVGLPTRTPSWLKSHFTTEGAGSKKNLQVGHFFPFSSSKTKGEMQPFPS